MKPEIWYGYYTNVHSNIYFAFKDHKDNFKIRHPLFYCYNEQLQAN